MLSDLLAAYRLGLSRNPTGPSRKPPSVAVGDGAGERHDAARLQCVDCQGGGGFKTRRSGPRGGLLGADSQRPPVRGPQVRRRPCAGSARRGRYLPVLGLLCIWEEFNGTLGLDRGLLFTLRASRVMAGAAPACSSRTSGAILSSSKSPSLTPCQSAWGASMRI